MAPAQVFATSDGYAVLFISTDKFWRRFCEIIGWTERAVDPKFATMAARSENRDEVIALTAELMKTRDTAAWVDLLGSEGIVISGIETLESALDGDLAASRDMVVVIPTPDGPLRVVGNPIKLSDHGAHYAPPPLLGEHSDEVLAGPVATAAK
jgi:crotonobetainyl-CoA:carnitine CoA-transferase CaiB-like acyl-CoA transferase